MWGSLDWEVTPLQTLGGRAELEGKSLEEIKK
jgi:hypothetical protein